MNNDLISRSELKKALKSNCDTLCNDKNTNWCEHCCPLNDFEDLIDNIPTVNFIISPDYVTELQNINKELIKQLEELKKPQGDFTREELESWLYRIASNNLDNELGRSCEEIICRLNGFERFVSDMRKGGAE